VTQVERAATQVEQAVTLGELDLRRFLFDL
jgi:hypothetical protein